VRRRVFEIKPILGESVPSNDNEIYQQERPDKQYYGGADSIVARLEALSLLSGSRACLKLRTKLNYLDDRQRKFG
jgi:hypothetical protein